MTKMQLLEELATLDLDERLAVVEAAVLSIRDELTQRQPYETAAERTTQLAAAAAALLPDYEAGGELTAFTSLDAEPVHAQG
jgi:hypothetical protein